MTKITPNPIVAGAALIALAAALWFSLSAMLFPAKDNVLWESPSSDSHWKVTGFERSWGNGSTYRTLISIGKAEATSPENAHVIFAAAGKIMANASWAGGDKLIIQYSANKVFKRETKWHGIAIAYQEVP